jgi:hypothetical protein
MLSNRVRRKGQSPFFFSDFQLFEPKKKKKKFKKRIVKSSILLTLRQLTSWMPLTLASLKIIDVE